MARRKHSVFVKHFAAMQLILTMQDADGSTPNVAYVRKYPTPPKVADFPPDQKYNMFKYLLDMLPLLDEGVYYAFHTMLNQPMSVAGIMLNQASVENGMQFNASVLQRTTDLGKVAMWSDDPPHGCYLIMREVVADLLA